MSSHNFDETASTKDVLAVLGDNVRGKTFALTGPSPGGLGASVLLALAQHHPHLLLLLGRNPSKIAPLIPQLQSLSPSTSVVFVPLDLASLASVRAAVPQIRSALKQHGSEGIDGLINCAGVLCPEKFTKSEDGIEIQFAANHLGHFLLTNLLRQEVQAKQGIVINVSSGGHCFSDEDFKNYNCDDGATYNRWQSYARSKAANIHFSVALAKRGVTSLAPTPGTVNGTQLRQNTNVTDEVMMAAGDVAAQQGVDAMKHAHLASVDEGTAALLIALLDPTLREYSGSYMYMNKVGGNEPFAQDAQIAEDLWKISEKLVGQEFAF